MSEHEDHCWFCRKFGKIFDAYEKHKRDNPDLKMTKYRRPYTSHDDLTGFCFCGQDMYYMTAPEIEQHFLNHKRKRESPI